MSNDPIYSVIHFKVSLASRSPLKELEVFKTDDKIQATAKYNEWITRGGADDEAIYCFDYLLFGGSTNKHDFGVERQKKLKKAI